jgi:hypothetical protein
MNTAFVPTTQGVALGCYVTALVINPSFLRMQESRELGNGFPHSRE